MIEVACAIVEHKGAVMAAQRGPQMSHTGKWEFPGGKIQLGETAKEALTRELWEELRMRILPFDELPPAPFSYPDKEIILFPFRCHWLEGTPTLVEHQAIRWLQPEDLPSLDWAGADLPILQNYLNNLPSFDRW